MRIAIGLFTFAAVLGCAGLGGEGFEDAAALGLERPEPAPEEAAEAEAAAVDSAAPSADDEGGPDASDISLVALSLAGELADAEAQPPPFSDEPPPEVSAEERAERVDTLAAWVTETPDVVPHRELLLDRLRAHAEEASPEAWAGLQADLEAKEPLQVSVATAPWRVIVAFAQSYDTSEDWAFFVGDIQAAVRDHAVGTGQLGWGQAEVQVVRRGNPVATIEVPQEVLEPFAQGYLVVMEGKEPVVFGHAPPHELLPKMGEVLGLSLKAK